VLHTWVADYLSFADCHTGWAQIDHLGCIRGMARRKEYRHHQRTQGLDVEKRLAISVFGGWQNCHHPADEPDTRQARDG
jgi:hypothetical protein